MDVLKRWARLVKGLQIRRRLQAQYQRADMVTDLTGGAGDVNAKGELGSKRQIVVETSGAHPEFGSMLQSSHDTATPVADGLDVEVRYPIGGSLFSCGVGCVKLILYSSVHRRRITIRTYSMQEDSSPPRTRSYSPSAFHDPSIHDSEIALHPCRLAKMVRK